MRRILLAPALSLIGFVWLSCGGEDGGPTAPSTGSIQVSLEMSGEDLDPDGCELSVDGGSPQTITRGSSLTFSGLAVGTHSVLLNDVSSNCTVEGSNPRSVSVTAGTTVQVTFSATCSATTGRLEVTVATTGEDVDADGYTLTLDGGASRPLAVNGTVTFFDLSPGSHHVQLGDLADNCELSGPGTRTVTVVAGDTAAVVFAATCARIVRLAFLVQPSDMEIGGVLSPAVQVATEDASGTIITDAATQVTIRAHDEQEQVVQTWSSSVVDGVASFGGIRILTVGSYSLEATATGAAPAISDPFSITFPPIAYSSFAGADTRDVFLLSDTATLNLTNHPAEDYQPAWSPDGAQIAFASDRDGDFDIYVMNADGSGITQLTNHPTYDGQPSWSPDGSSIVFMCSRDGMNICIMNTDGSGVVSIADNRGLNSDPDWSPDGTEIAWIGPGPESLEVCVMEVDGANPRCITQNPRNDYAPRWSPDGTSIAYYSLEADNTFAVYIVDVAGSTEVSLSNSTGVHDYTPDWSPDGSRLVFGSTRDPGAGLYMMNPDGSDVVHLTIDGGVSPAWKPLP